MTAPPPRTACPRCGHDLRGVIASWREACPLTGICTECGLEFAWGDLLSGRLHYPRWCVEGARGALDWTRRAIPHLAMVTARPRATLRQLRLEHVIRPVPLLATFAMLVLIIAAATWGALSVHYLQAGVTPAEAATLGLQPWRGQPTLQRIRPPRAGASRVAVMQPDGRTQIVDTAFNGWTPVIRPVPRGMPIPEDGLRLFGAPDVLEIETDAGRVVWIQPGRRGPTPRAAIDAARATTTVTVALPGPRTVLDGSSEAVVLIVVGLILPIVLTTTCAVGAFVLLPIARRRARVRWAHLGRLTSYAALGSLGLGVVLVAVEVAVGVSSQLGALRSVFGGLSSALAFMFEEEDLLLITAVCLVPITVAGTWWSWAAGHYLRMSRPWGVGMSVAAVTNVSLIAGLFLLARAFA
jgi:hypothetical protein